MKFATTYRRNKAIFKDYLEGMMVPELMEKYTVTKAMVTTEMRQVLEALQEHTDYAGGTSLDRDILRQNKSAIVHYLETRIPTTPLTPQAKQLLKDEFGERYGQMPDVVAERWRETAFAKKRYVYYRDLESIRTWLASEGFLVDDFLSQAMIDEAFIQIKSALKTMPHHKTLNINLRDTTQDKRVAYINVDINTDKHVAQRRLKLELLPAH